MLDKRLFDWTNLILGLWMIVSPWLLGYTASAAAMWSALILGVVICAISWWALARPDERAPEGSNLFMGIVTFLSPWVLGFSAVTAGAWNHWTVGTVLVIFAAYTLIPRMWTPHHEPMH